MDKIDHFKKLLDFIIEKETDKSKQDELIVSLIIVLGIDYSIEYDH